MTKKSNLKKIIGSFVTLAIIFALATSSSVYAAKKTAEITSSTVVTDKNIYQVLNYVGLDSSSFTASATADYDNITVGELKAAVDEAKQAPEEIVSTSVVTPSKAPVLESNIPILESNMLSSYSSSMTLESDFDIGSAVITFHAVGHYIGSYWTSASASNADVDSDFLIYTYKLSDQTNTTTCTSTCITLNCSGKLNTYVGVGDFGIVKIATQTYSSTNRFYASSYL